MLKRESGIRGTLPKVKRELSTVDVDTAVKLSFHECVVTCPGCKSINRTKLKNKKIKKSAAE